MNHQHRFLSFSHVFFYCFNNFLESTAHPKHFGLLWCISTAHPKHFGLLWCILRQCRCYFSLSSFFPSFTFSSIVSTNFQKVLLIQNILVAYGVYSLLFMKIYISLADDGFVGENSSHGIRRPSDIWVSLVVYSRPRCVVLGNTRCSQR